MTATSPRLAGGETTRQRVIRVSTELFARNGYHGTGIAELTAATGLSRGALYHHIRNKEHLLFGIAMELLEPMIAVAERIVDEDRDPVVKLRALARSLVREHAVHGDAWGLIVTEIRSLTPEHRKTVVETRAAYEQLWTDVLAEGAASGMLRPVDDLERRAILGMLNSTRRWIRTEGPLTVDEIADRHVDLLLDGIRAV